MGSDYIHVFSPITIRGVEYKNRVELAPTSPKFTSKEGYLTKEHIDYFRAAARGGTAIITLGNCSVDIAHAQDEPRQVGLDNDDYLMGMGRFVDMCDRYGAIGSMEINHAGLDALYDFNGVPAIGPTSFILEREILRAKLAGREPVPAIEMTIDMIHAVQRMYIEAAYRCKRSGMKMCLVHGGHTNLIGQFSSPLYNRRKDEYGGSLENRARFAIEILDGIRNRCGQDFVIEFRISADEMHPDGMHFDETKEYMQMLDEKIDIVNVSCGIHTERKYFRYWSPNMYMSDMVNVPYARELKKILKCKINTVAGICNLDNAERIISEGWADFVSMARPLMADPEMVRKYAFNKPEEVRPCARCDYCSRRINGIRTVGCGINPMLGRESEFRDGNLPPAPDKKKVVVIGAGPAGMVASIVLSKRGHDVTLFEKENDIGGHLEEAASMDIKIHMRRYRDYIKRQTRNQVADIRTGTCATPELLKELNPDALVVAVGASHCMPEIPGIDLPHVHWAADAEMGRCETGDNIAVIGGGWLGIECAFTQTEKNAKVSLFSRRPNLAGIKAADELLSRIKEKGAAVFPSHRLDEILPDRIICTNLNTGERIEHECDTVLISAGMRPRIEEVEKFRHVLPETEVYICGDAKQPRTVPDAVIDGFNAAVNI
ncbi:MAG: FAD-dependent oxidoreductase [Clostridiales bacterium]|nr:FAD-dependent oxidoreductase [Clostridiales bacterium]